MQVLATNLSEHAVDFREIDYFANLYYDGARKTGFSQQALALADKHIIIPMAGMVQSLNVSVASALILYEAQRQRQQAGMYERDHCFSHQMNNKLGYLKEVTLYWLKLLNVRDFSPIYQ